MPFDAVVDGGDERRGVTDPRGRLLLMLVVERVNSRGKAQWDGYSCSASYAVPERPAGRNNQGLPLRCDGTGM